MQKKHIGISLLFIESDNNQINGVLKSYVLKLENSWEKLLLKTEKVSRDKNNNKLKFIGIQDVFRVSGAFKEFCILGKSYLKEDVSVPLAKKLLMPEKGYSINKRKPSVKKGWVLVSLIYFYFNPRTGDALSVACLTPVKYSSLSDIKNRINTIAVKDEFKGLVINKVIDKMNYNYLEYIGIENITYIDENPSKSEAFQICYKEKIKTFEIFNVLPENKELYDKFKFILRTA